MALKTISINIGSLTTTQFDNIAAVAWGYEATIPDPSNPGLTVANPETKSAFVRRMFLTFAQQRYDTGLINPAMDTARTNAINSTVIFT